MNAASQFASFFRALAATLLTALAVLTSALQAGCTRQVESSPTFSEDVLPILQDHCQDCHRPRGSAPMPLITYQQVRSWGPAVREVTVSRTMPPFHAAGPIGRYRDDPRLTREQIDTLASWVDGGFAPGPEEARPPPHRWPDSKWSLGEPDVVMHSAPFEVSAGSDAYPLILLDQEMSSDRWIAGIEILTQDDSFVHHAGLHTVDPALTADQVGDGTSALALTDALGPLLTAWVPGQEGKRFAEGTALRVEAGTRFAASMHYAPRSEPLTDRVTVGLHYANGTIERQLHRLIVEPDGHFEIPPHEPSYQHRVEHRFERDVIVHGFSVHMHLRGASNRVDVLEGANRRTLFDVPRYDFDWQRHYQLTEPTFVPATATWIFEGTFDNSAGNPSNPDPDQRVVYGLASTDEMWLNAVVYEYADAEFDALVVRDGLPAP